MGDPAGIGPKVLLLALTRLKTVPPLTVIGDLLHLKRLSRRLGLSIPWFRMEWVDLGDLCSGIRAGEVQPRAGRAAFAWLKEAVRLLKYGKAQ